MEFPVTVIVLLFALCAVTCRGVHDPLTKWPNGDPLLHIGPVADSAYATKAVYARASPAAGISPHLGATTALTLPWSFLAVHIAWLGHLATPESAPVGATPESAPVDLVVDKNDPKGWKWWWRLVIDIIASISIWLLLTALFAIYWDQCKEYKMVLPHDGKSHLPQDLDGGWKFGLCDCCGDPGTCCLAFCCPAVRWADTVRMSGFLGFGCGVTCFVCCQLVYNLLFLPVGAIPLALMGTHYRQKLRKKFDIPHGTLSTILQDCLVYSFCACLAITQEAQTLEEAYLVRHPAVEDARDELMRDFDFPASWGQQQRAAASV